MDNIEKFIQLFSEFDLQIVSKGRPDSNKPYQTVERYDGVVQRSNSEQKSKNDLKKTLNRLQKEYKNALRSFKLNKISRQELFDFEWRLFEIQEEIRKLEDEDANGAA